MTASDVRTSVHSVGAVEGNKVDDNSKACCPITRVGSRPQGKTFRHLCGKAEVRVCEPPRLVTAGPCAWLAMDSLRALWGVREEELDSYGHRMCRLESSEPADPHLQPSAGRRKQGLHSSGDGDRHDLSGGQFGSAYQSPRNLCPFGPVTLCLRFSVEENRYTGGAIRIFFFSGQSCSLQ